MTFKPYTVATNKQSIEPPFWSEPILNFFSPQESDQNDDGISHLEWETVRVRFVKAGSLEKLVESLAAPDTGELESTYINVFLATYRTFASPKQVLNLLIERWDITYNLKIRDIYYFSVCDSRVYFGLDAPPLFL